MNTRSKQDREAIHEIESRSPHSDKKSMAHTLWVQKEVLKYIEQDRAIASITPSLFRDILTPKVYDEALELCRKTLHIEAMSHMAGVLLGCKPENALKEIKYYFGEE